MIKIVAAATYFPPLDRGLYVLHWLVARTMANVKSSLTRSFMVEYAPWFLLTARHHIGYVSHFHTFVHMNDSFGCTLLYLHETNGSSAIFDALVTISIRNWIWIRKPFLIKLLVLTKIFLKFKCWLNTLGKKKWKNCISIYIKTTSIKDSISDNPAEPINGSGLLNKVT